MKESIKHEIAQLSDTDFITLISDELESRSLPIAVSESGELEADYYGIVGWLESDPTQTYVFTANSKVQSYVPHKAKCPECDSIVVANAESAVCPKCHTTIAQLTL